MVYATPAPSNQPFIGLKQATTRQSFTRPPRSWTLRFAGLLLVLMRAAPHANPDEVIGVRYKLEATRAALPSR